MNQIILPPATIGIIGGGQLGQMLSQISKSMGYKVVILDPTKDCPASQVSDKQIIAQYDDKKALIELANTCDVLTYEFENINLKALEEVKLITKLPQGTDLLRLTRNRLVEKNNLQKLNIPTVDYVQINNQTQLQNNFDITKCLPGILKTVTGGYDGHGQIDVNTIEDIKNAAKFYEYEPAILEKKINFEKEISVMVTTDGNEDIKVWPIVENIHQNHILQTTIVPAEVSNNISKKVQKIANKLAKSFNLKGVLGVEMFVTSTGEVLVNELAPRPHNSGHYSIEAMNVSQFEGHIRSIMGLPIDDLVLIKPALMHNLLGSDIEYARLALKNHSEWHFHDYGKKDIKPGRKMGHYTVLGLKDIQANANWLTNKG